MKAPTDQSQSLEARVRELEATVKLRTEQLIASTSRAYSFLDSLHMGFIMCDVNPEVVLTNTSVRGFLSEQPTEEWTLAAIDQLLEPQLHLKELVTQSLKEQRSMEFNEVNLGKRVLRLFIAPMTPEMKGDAQPIGAVILVEDVTEQKVLERSKDEFFFIASHELRTPLTAIRGNASVIRKYYPEIMKNQDFAAMVDDIHASSVRLIELVNDFLDVSALEQGKIKMQPEAFKLGEVVSEVVRELASLGDAKGLKLVAGPGLEALPAVMADRKRVKQVVVNLVGNAIKFTDAGSITVDGVAEGKFVHCTVTDTGSGMSDENQKLLFRKFQQAGTSIISRDTTQGTGLGLYISKLIVELSGGKIILERSEVGKGSTFGFTVPVA